MSEPTARREGNGKTKVFSVLLLCLFSVVVYWNTLKNDFVNYDDYALVLEKPYVKSFSITSLRDQFRPDISGPLGPVRNLSYSMDYYLWADNPFGYHLTNLLLHILSSVAFYLCLMSIMKEPVVPLLSALLFTVHPLQVEPVAWVSGRKEVLCGFFFFASFYLFLRFLDAGRYRAKVFTYVCSLFSFILALMSKQVTVTLPVVLILYEFYFRSRQQRGSLRAMGLRYAPFVAVALALFVASSLVAISKGGVKVYPGTSVYSMLATMPVVYARYLIQLLFPVKLSATYFVFIYKSFLDPAVLASLLVLAIVLALCVIVLRYTRRAGFFVLWAFVTFAPVSGIVPTTIPMADRYLHLSLAGLCTLAGIALTGIPALAKPGINRLPHRKIVLTAMVFLIFFFSLRCIKRNLDWRDSCTLWTKTVSVSPSSAVAHLGLGVCYYEQGDLDRAMTEYLIANHLNPYSARIYHNLAAVYSARGWYQRAIEALNNSLRLRPEFAPTHYALGRVYETIGQHDAAEAEYTRALEISPTFAKAYYALGRIYAQRGLEEQASQYFETAFQLDPQLGTSGALQDSVAPRR